MNKSSYIYALDLSMSCTGVVIFDSDNDDIAQRDKTVPVLVTSVETSPKLEDGKRLKIIADFLLDLRKKYQPKLVLIENGFYRFAKSTEVVFMVHGVVRYIFEDVEQIFYAPTTVKKFAGKKGNMKKDELREIILSKYPNVTFSNNDESDAFAIGLTYFIKTGVIQ